MSSEYAMSWCQDCRRWVPKNKMNYFKNLRVCQWCLDGFITPEKYIHDPHFEEVQCIFCDSWDTMQVQGYSTYKCNTCGETFVL